MLGDMGNIGADLGMGNLGGGNDDYWIIIIKAIKIIIK